MSSITSYAQNFEDVMLWRALSHVGEGFYIDVGAQDPVVDSVSLLFYERGWRGVHVEPTPYYAELLRRSRTGDVVIQAAVGLGHDEILPFFEIPQTGISTADPEMAQRHRARGVEVREIRVPCVTLASIFEIIGQRDVHWLKIDVEGLEYQVLAGWGATHVRPWIVVVESTLPLTRIERHQEWDPVLLGYGYTHAYFDGLNRYYISADHPELRDAFSLPPNIFDEFALNGTANAPFHRLILSRHEAELKVAREVVQAADAKAAVEAASQRERISDLESELLLKQEELASSTEEVMSVTLRCQMELQGVREEICAVQSRSGAEAASHSEHAKELESALRQQQRELASRASEVIALTSHYQTELEATRAKLDAALAEAASASAADGKRLRDLEFVMARQREELTLRAHELTVELESRRAAYDAVSRALADKQSLAIEQRDLLRASERRELSVLGQIGVLQKQLIEAQQREREFDAELLERQQRARQEMQALVERHDVALKSASAQHRDECRALAAQLHQQRAAADFAIRAKHEQELVSERQATLLREAAVHESDLEEARSALSAQLHAEREQRRVERGVSEAVQAELDVLKRTLSWRVTAPLGLFKRRRHTICIQSSTIDPQLSTEGIPLPPQRHTVPGFGAVGLMSQIVKHRPPLETASSITDILQLHHEDFVECAYRTVLKRTADQEGLAHYTNRVLGGHPKIEILCDLYRSAEAKEKGVDLPWLQRAIARHEVRNRPSWRFFRKIWRFGAARAELADRLRMIEERVSYLQRQSVAARADLTARLGIVEESLRGRGGQSGTHSGQPAQMAEQPPGMTESGDVGRDSAERDASAPPAGVLVGRSLVGKRIIRDLSTAIREANAGSVVRARL